MKHRGINFSIVEMSFPHSWKWTVGKGKTVSVGVCATRLDAIRQAQTFIESVLDWAASTTAGARARCSNVSNDSCRVGKSWTSCVGRLISVERCRSGIGIARLSRRL